MDEAEHYEVEDSDVEAVMPPKDLLQTAREILARPVTQQELARAWDRSSHLPTEEQRVAACLDRLLMSEVDNNNPVPLPVAATSANVQAPPREASTPVSTPARATPPKKVIIDLSEDTPEVATTTALRRKRSWNAANNDSFVLEVPERPAKIRRTAASSDKQSDKTRKNLQQNDPEVLPGWLLQEFAAVAAAPGPAFPEPAPAAARKASPPVQAPAAPAKNTIPQDVPLWDVPPAVEAEPLSPLAQILAIIPDVDPDHAEQLSKAHSSDPATCVEHVIEVLFSKSYPKAQSSSKDKGKEKEKSQAEEDPLVKLKAYLDKDTRTRTEGVPSFTYREAA